MSEGLYLVEGMVFAQILEVVLSCHEIKVLFAMVGLGENCFLMYCYFEHNEMTSEHVPKASILSKIVFFILFNILFFARLCCKCCKLEICFI